MLESSTEHTEKLTTCCSILHCIVLDKNIQYIEERFHLENKTVRLKKLVVAATAAFFKFSYSVSDEVYMGTADC